MTNPTPCNSKTISSDVFIIGAGPAGLSLARALAPSGLNITLIEKQTQQTLQDPPFDGREIALTHYSKELMQQLDMWSHIPANEIYPLRDAKVVNGRSHYQLHFKQPTQARGKPADSLGFLISNHHIRRAAYQAIQPFSNIHLMCGEDVSHVSTNKQEVQIQLKNGQTGHGQLLVAADSRFSNTRRQLGISAQMRDFGRTIIVFRMQHTLSNNHSAYECFYYGRTLALLPLEENITNCVVTLSNNEVDDFLALSPQALASEIEGQLRSQLGQMTLASEIHHYPLVGVHANAFYAIRSALIGDTAVGMHPVTAHGFNLGLSGVQILAQLINQAVNTGCDIASAALLARYQKQHMPQTRLLYHGTNAMVSLFTNDSTPAHWLRSFVLRASNNFPPLKNLISKQLTG